MSAAPPAPGVTQPSLLASQMQAECKEGAQASGELQPFDGAAAALPGACAPARRARVCGQRHCSLPGAGHAPARRGAGWRRPAAGATVRLPALPGLRLRRSVDGSPPSRAHAARAALTTRAPTALAGAAALPRGRRCGERQRRRRRRVAAPLAAAAGGVRARRGRDGRRARQLQLRGAPRDARYQPPPRGVRPPAARRAAGGHGQEGHQGRRRDRAQVRRPAGAAGRRDGRLQGGACAPGARARRAGHRDRHRQPRHLGPVQHGAPRCARAVGAAATLVVSDKAGIARARSLSRRLASGCSPPGARGEARAPSGRSRSGATGSAALVRLHLCVAARASPHLTLADYRPAVAAQGGRLAGGRAVAGGA